MDEKKYEEMYRKLLEFENGTHEKNMRRIKAGIVCIFVIPLAFLILMFLTDSSKPVFLTLWIVSLYAIAIYLIGVEYSDYKLQKNLAMLRGEDDVEVKALIGQNLENIEETLREARANALSVFAPKEETGDKETDEEHH